MLKIIILTFFLSIGLYGQRLEIKSAFVGDYPEIQLDIDAFRANNQQYRGIETDDLQVFENGIQRDIISKFCEDDDIRFSLIISIDASGSMLLNEAGDQVVSKPNRRYDLILRSVELLVQNLNLEKTEVALMISLGASEIVLEYSQDFAEIRQAIRTFPETGNVADINAAFVGKNKFGARKGIGSLEYAEQARWKPVVIYFSDAGQTGDEVNPQPPVLGDIREDWINEKNAEVEAIIYNVNYGNYPNSKLNSISSLSGGRMYDGVKTESETQLLLIDILDEVTNNPAALAPCEVRFLTDCSGGGDIVINSTIDGTPVTATYTYTIPDNVKPDLLIDNRTPDFLNVLQGDSQDFTINVTAQDNKVKVTGFISSDSRFEVLDIGGGFELQKDESRNLRVRFTPDVERECITPTIDIISDACSGNRFTPKAGWMRALNVNVGSAILGETVTNVRESFENLTCDPITITSISIEKAEFTHGANLPLTIPAGETREIEFSYTPSVTGAFSSEYTVTVDGNDYTATLNAGGVGNANIEVTASNYPTVNCDETSEIRFYIENSGEVPLEVDEINWVNVNDFALVSPLAQFSVPAGGNQEVVFNFIPQNEGSKTTNVTIVSNAANDNNLTFDISGKRNDISAFAERIDIGVICPDTDYEFDLVITNNGEIATDVSLQSTFPEITFPNGATLNLNNVGAQHTTKIKVNIPNEGPFNGTIIVLDECGDQQTVANVEGEVRLARVDYEDISSIGINTNLNEPVTEIIEIRNLDNRPLENLQFTINDNPTEFTIVNAPTTVAGSGIMTLEVQFLPTTPGTKDLNITVTGDVDGNACLTTQLATINGSTNVAEATLSIGDYTGLIGQIITLEDITLTDISGFASSGVSEFEVEVKVNQYLLESADMLPDVVVGEERIITYSYNVAAPMPLRLRVLDPNDPNINTSNVDVSVVSTVPAGRALINSINGNFQLTRATGEVVTQNLSADIGQNVSIVLTGANFQEVDANFHQTIRGELRANATILIPRGNTPLGRIETEFGTKFRYIPFEMQLAPPSGEVGIQTAEAVPVTLNFTTVMGTDESTTLELRNLESENGVIELSAPAISEFNINDLCKDSQGRVMMLWHSDQSMPITVLGKNPVTESTDFRVNAFEDGPYKIYITDFSGNIVNDVFQGELNRGEYNFNIDPVKYSQGTYFINVISPSERFTQNFMFIK